MAQNEWAVVSETPIARTAGTGWEVVEQKPTTGAFAAGVKSYLPQVQETFGGLKTLLGVGAERVLGEGQISRGLIESGAASMKEAEAKRQPFMTAERGSFTDALNKGVGTVLTEWLPYQAGSGAAQLVEALALVGAGGLAGTMTAPGPGTLAGAGTGLVARELAKRGVKEAAEKILKERGEDAAKVYFEKAAKDVALDIGKKRGQTAALAGQAAFYGTGQTTSRAVEEAEKLGGTATDIELARVLPAAAVSTVAEFIGDKIALGALKGLKPGTPGKFVATDLAKNILLNIGLTGTKEVPVEVIQSAAERFGAKLSLTDAQALKEYIDATAASYGMAVAPGVGGGVRQTIAERAKPAPEVPPAAPVAPPAAEVPPVTPEQVRERVEEVTGVSRAAPPSAEESVLGRLYKLGDAEAEAAREELTQQRLQRQQAQIDAEAERIAELNRSQGMPSPDRPKLEIEERPSIAEQAPELTPREELLAKQAEVDQRRLEAGLATGESSLTPGVEPTQTVEEPKPVPKIVDNRPLTERAANNRLLVMRNMLQNQGGDPESLTIVPHPTAEGKFAIQSLDVPTKLTPDLPGTAITRPETPTIIDPVNAYVEIQRRTNTPAARRFVQDFDAGRITREDVERAVEQEQKAEQPQPLTYTSTGEPGIVAAEVSKPRGEREVPKIGEVPPKVETPPEEPPGQEPPTPKAAMPQTLQEFEERMPIVFDRAEVREANNEGNFAKLTKALQLSKNPAVRRIGQLGSGISSKITLKKPGRLGAGVAGVYRYADDSIQMIPNHAGNEHTNAHETLHALISKAQRYPTDRQKPIVADIEKLFSHVKKELKRKGVTAYGLTNVREFTAEAMTNPQFQFELMQLPYPGKKSSWTQFVKLVADLLGIQNTNALTEVMNLVDRLATQKQPRKTVTDKELVDEMAMPEEAVSGETKAASGSIGGRNPGEQAISIVNQMKMGIPPAKPTFGQQTIAILKGEQQLPTLDLKTAKEVAMKFSDTFEKNIFSADAAFENAVRRGVREAVKDNDKVIGLVLQAGQSQIVNIDNVTSRAIIEGASEYNEDMQKWQSVKKEENLKAQTAKLEEISKKYNLPLDEVKSVAHAYLVTKRLPGILERNAKFTEEIEAEKKTAKPDRKKIEELKALIVYVSPTQRAQMEPGQSLVKLIPELEQVSDIWQGMRKNTIKTMVEGGLHTQEYAEALLDNIDYVPYYRVEQLEEDAGPLEFLRGLQVKAKEHRLKGSDSPVNDVFDNQVRWMQYAMSRTMRAHKARQMIDVAKDIDIGGRKMAVKVTEQKRGMNIVRIYRDGKQEMWDVADPNFIDAFAAIQNVSIPMFKWAAKAAEILRNTVVLYPLFSVAQVPQDSMAAVFTSGLKPQHALKIPYLAVQEFIKTIAKTSATHNELKKFGVVGARDFSADVMRKDAEIEAGLKQPKGAWGKTKEILEHVAMAGDNAVRQATYIASKQQGLSEKEALEKAFEIFNVRRRGTSKALNLAGQTIPFFYAYLAAQRVAYRTITGVGTSPTERKAALTTLAATSASVMVLSMIYAMMVGDDEDYAETPAAVRDRTLMIPGSGGVRIPLRPDFFLFPKIIAEHTYQLITDKGYEDGAKFRTSMFDALVNAVSSPTAIPQIVKPALEVAINYDFFQGKPLIGTFEKNKDLERQFRDTTSELAKLFGQTGMVSPIAVDHLIRGMLGSFGGLMLYGTNMFLHSDPDVPRPEMSAKEMLAALPGTAGFLKRPQESALKNDFFVLRDAVEKAANTFNDIKTRSPEGIEAFLEDEKNAIRLGMAKGVDKINRHLSDIRRRMTIITNMPESQMPADEKAENIRELRELEREILRSVNVKELREMAKI